MGDLARDFSRNEFECHCGCGKADVTPRLVEALQALRDLANVPIRVNSGCRCPAHNEAVHGETDSQHLLGNAADIVIEKLSTSEMIALAEQIPAFQDGGIGEYPNDGFIHVDVRNGRARWSDTNPLRPSNGPSEDRAPRFCVGQEVQLIAQPAKRGVITKIGPRKGFIQDYYVFWADATGTARVAEAELKLRQSALAPSESLISGNTGGWADFQRLITFTRLSQEQPLANYLYALNASRTKFFAHQFKPLLKTLDSPAQRLLIADEVGLGKTIEAGLILMEMRARQSLTRLLVTCPAKLCDKWNMELRKRFDEDFRVTNASEFRRFLRDYAEDPERTRLRAIVSLESLRQRAIIDELETVQPELDFLVVDEAHYARNRGTLTHTVVEALSRCTSASGTMLFLTATPIHLHSEDLFSLLKMLDPEAFPSRETAENRLRANEHVVLAQNYMAVQPPRLAEAIACLDAARQSFWFQRDPLLSGVLKDVAELAHSNTASSARTRTVVSIQRRLAELNLTGHVLTRTRKREVHEGLAVRKPYAVAVDLTDSEKHFYDAVTLFVRRKSESLGHLPHIQQWHLHMPQRRVASCIPAMVNYYRCHLCDTLDDVMSQFDYVENDDTAEANDRGVQEAFEGLKSIVESWDPATPDSKMAQLLRVLTEVRCIDGNKVVVFSFFKDTLRYLAKGLHQEGYSVAVITGDDPVDSRGHIIETFRRDVGKHVLLTSRVGSEGLDFQFCSTLVNYDLPWNPMEVEQRIGRLDRIGQKAKEIRIYNLFAAGTIEDRVLMRLYNRIRLFEHTIGLLEPIVGQLVRDLETQVLGAEMSPEEEERLVEEKAIIVENKLRNLEDLEQNAERFLGVDAFFEEEVKAVRRGRRYSTAEQVRNFLEDFFRVFCPRARLEKGRHGDLVLVSDSELHNRVLNAGFGAVFPGTNGGCQIPVTFDSDVAFENPDIEFVNILHPIVKVACEAYRDHPDRLVCAHDFILETDSLRPAVYFFFVFLYSLRGARDRYIMEPVVFDSDLTVAAEGQRAEEIMGEMMEDGRENDVVREPPPSSVLVDAARRAENYALDLRRSLSQELDQQNQAFIDRRKRSLEEFYGRKIAALRAIIERRTAEGVSERILRMSRGTLRKLEAQQEQKIADVESKGQVSVMMSEIAAGILRIGSCR